jgi:hypothetical protein
VPRRAIEPHVIALVPAELLDGLMPRVCKGTQQVGKVSVRAGTIDPALNKGAADMDYLIFESLEDA